MKIRLKDALDKYTRKHLSTMSGLSMPMIQKAKTMVAEGRDIRVEVTQDKAVFWERMPAWREIKPKSWSRRKRIEG